jgi:hypothetical protein
MDHPPIDADFFANINQLIDPDQPPIKQAYRKIADEPITGYYQDRSGAVHVQDYNDIPYLSIVEDRMPNVRASAVVTGSVGARQVEVIGAEQIVIEWRREIPAPAPAHPRRKPFADRKVETSFLLAAPPSYEGMPVVTSVYIPHDFGKEPAHLFVYYAGPKIHWGPEAIGGREKLFGLAYVQYDDANESMDYTKMRQRLTYAEALALFVETLSEGLAT